MDKTLLKGLQVLNHVATAEQSVRISDVAKALGLTKSNAYRVLRTLEAADFVKQDANTKGFSATLKLWELGIHVVNKLNIRDLASDALNKLAKESRETVHLAVLDNSEVIYIAKIDSAEPVSSYTRLGGRAPAYCVATGKALLAQLPDEELCDVVGVMEKHSPNTITDLDALRVELDEIRSSGCSINRGEWRETVWGLAAVIKDGTGRVVAAVGVSGPSYRFDRDGRCAELAGMVALAAKSISKSIM